MGRFASQSLVKFIMMATIGMVLVSGITACGKRGDPYRPSEVPTKSASLS